MDKRKNTAVSIDPSPIEIPGCQINKNCCMLFGCDSIYNGRKSFRYSPTERLISFEKSELYFRLQNAFI